ncbi:MAG: zinc ABC transporter substrate-binding protein [Alphaproteobacteria bacterium]|nr:zinc ABC transporter substrate-binding protein [Alphaproteobacteria bacterium]
MGWVVAVSLALALAAPATAHANDDGKVRVIATFSILADMARNVGGDRVSVESLVAPGSDAHVYRPTPRSAAHIKRADVVIENGLGFEGWLERLIATSGYRGIRVVASRGIATLEAKGDAGGHGHGHHHDHGTHAHRAERGHVDPHAWQSLANGTRYVANIAKGLCSADPEGCGDYNKNAADYQQRLQALDAQVRQRVSAIAKERRKVITSHDAFGYFAQRYGVVMHSPEGLSTESEASAKDVAKLIHQIRNEGIRALFIENVSDARLIEQIARETGLKPAGRLYSDALAVDGEAASYIGMMQANASAIATALEAGGDVGPL